MTTIRQDADAVQDYRIDWTLADDDIITDSTFTVDGLTKGATSFTDTTTTVWLSDGAKGGRYVVTNHVTTDQGRQGDFEFTVIVT